MFNRMAACRRRRFRSGARLAAAGTFFAALSLLLPACDLLEPSAAAPGTAIQFKESGGIVGGSLLQLRISSVGVAVREDITPPLQQQLGSEEYMQLLGLFADFASLDEKYNAVICADDVLFEITFGDSSRRKTVRVWGCSLEAGRMPQHDLTTLKNIIDTLTELAQRILAQEAPWQGLVANFALDKDVYTQGEPLQFTYRVSNPTDGLRTLYFPGPDRVALDLSRHALPPFHYWYPEQPGGGALETLELQPGDTTALSLRWEQSIPDQNGGRQPLDPGRYYALMSLLDTSHAFRADRATVFDVVEPGVPLAGYIEPDYNSEWAEAGTYSFQLAVRNWTESPVTLHFPYSQHIRIKLFDLDRPALDPLPLLYEGPAALTAGPHDVTLQPDETRQFALKVAKSDLHLRKGYGWYAVEIELLATDFAFRRDGHVSIATN